MAPEAYRDEKCTEKVDVYSLSMMMWEMVTGKLPWEGSNFQEVRNAVANLGKRPPLPAELPDRISQLMTECWDPVPEKRPSAGEVCNFPFKRISSNALLSHAFLAPDVLPLSVHELPTAVCASSRYNSRTHARTHSLAPPTSLLLPHPYPHAHHLPTSRHFCLAQVLAKIESMGVKSRFVELRENRQREERERRENKVCLFMFHMENERWKYGRGER
jgi:serine/threonine protein kinase